MSEWRIDLRRKRVLKTAVPVKKKKKTIGSVLGFCRKLYMKHNLCIQLTRVKTMQESWWVLTL